MDIVGRHARLEPLEVDRHCETVFDITCGDPAQDFKAYDPQEVWSFEPEGPFDSPEELQQSFVFTHDLNEAAFAIVNNVTDRVYGVVLLQDDDPVNLSITLCAPILPPVRDGTSTQLEACFLLMDRLFAHGYRRIQMSVDVQDSPKRQLAMRLGFTLEGVLYKHAIVKEANRDTAIYGCINSDWKASNGSGGARQALFSKIYGKAQWRADQSNEAREHELEEQREHLAQQKEREDQAAMIAVTAERKDK
jgi:RimJ/RimL family protein N-acetyltransferase